MIPTNDVLLMQRGISQAALAHNAEISRLQAELHAAYENEIEDSSAVAERQRLSDQLAEAGNKLEILRKKLSDTERKLTALSESRLGALQLQYWRWRKVRRNG